MHAPSPLLRATSSHFAPFPEDFSTDDYIVVSGVVCSCKMAIRMQITFAIA